MRIVLEFDGDKSKLSLADRSTFATGKFLSGRDIAYATLMYIWSNKEPVGKIIPGPGLIAFTGVVVFTMLASQSFDPKLIWNRE